MARVFALLIAAALVTLALVLYVQLDAPISRVTVNGPLDDAERGQIRGVVADSLQGGLLSTDLDLLALAVMELSWPRSVSLRRVWPGSLVIEVEKPTVVARWQDAYLSSDGQVVRLPGERTALPVFDCRISPPRLAMETYHGLNELSSASGLRITTVSENDLGEWTLEFAAESGSSVSVVLGSEQLSGRLQRFLTVYEKALVPRLSDVASVDARYDNGVAVSWRQPTDSSLVAHADRYEQQAGKRL